MLNPKTIKACPSETLLSFILQLSPDPPLLWSPPPQSVLGSAPLCFSNSSPHPTPSPPTPPYPIPPHPRDHLLPFIMSCPGPLMSWKSFVPSVFSNTCTDAGAQMERVPLFQPPHIIPQPKSFVKRVRQLQKTISEVVENLIISPD